MPNHHEVAAACTFIGVMLAVEPLQQDAPASFDGALCLTNFSSLLRAGSWTWPGVQEANTVMSMPPPVVVLIALLPMVLATAHLSFLRGRSWSAKE